ncbi:hypothetical protein A3D68_02500 [Candidatus Adlerbacteria bacterium RIFCSPHIGHO2_02_FULL_52_17]|uniref:GH18 domain-containing protein n=1 Tax=Candidatus Adlerbacteria bacterium RIFCSPHIGHO2_02_FULL_52_17 TaxID=1797240 RepID=A0A1F4XNY7_9BACT|nr:MAG: hypothetical protein A3D68_02500 [Candidatus Adlerbacteria bacterium RIFCSPHIGHO2_02_FULL_52_17]
MHNIFFFIVFLLFLAPLGAQAATFETGGWIPYWRSATGTQDVLPRLTTLTTVHPFGYTVKNDGTLYDALGIDAEPWTTFINAAKQNKTRVIPSVMWSDGAAIHRILSNTTTRIALEDEIANLVKEKGFDGIDIDFEGKWAETSGYFSTFLKGLYMRMGNKWVYCTIEPRTPISSRYEGTPPTGTGTYANDYMQINKYCDRVQIMAYDQGSVDVKLNAANQGPYVPVADPKWVEKVVNLVAKDIPKRKLILGIPTYGYEYQVTPLSIEGYRYKMQWALNPEYAFALAGQLGLIPQRNSAGELSFTYIATTSPLYTSTAVVAGPALAAQNTGVFNIVWWSDALSVIDKVTLAKKLGLRGVAVFKFDGGEDQRIWNVLSAY